jgi:electron transfer flavoprotein beta subunit
MKLTIAVLVKQVPDHEAQILVRSDQQLDIENRYVCSFFDEIAMEAALVLQKAHPDAEVVALSAGGRRAVDALRRAVAMGIDRAEHLGDESLEQADSLLTARVLAARLKALQPGLILCGKQAGDDDQAAVGPMVAELLGMPHASAVVSLAVDPGGSGVTLGRKVEGEVWTLRGALPVLCTAEKSLVEPHVPVVTRVMKAMKATIGNIPLKELGIEGGDAALRLRRLRYLPPPTRRPVTMITKEFPENVAELVRCLQGSGVL